MAEIVITVIGDKQLSKMMSNPAIVDSEMIKATQQAGTTNITELRKYAPERPTSTYIRTGRLGRGWAEVKARKISNGVYQHGSKNPVSHEKWVQAIETQAAIHKGWWRTDRRILIENTKKFIGEYTAAIKNIKRRMGL